MMRSVQTFVIALLVGLFALPVLAESPAAKPEDVVRAPEVTVVGTNYCLGCALKKAHGAPAQCSRYGHRHVLRVESATDAAGRVIAGLAGRSLAYLENDDSAPLVKGEAFHGQKVQVKGRVYDAEGVVEVQSFAAP